MDVSNITVNKQNSIRIDAGKIIYIDPFDIEKNTNDADYIFITHDHYDHFSINDIQKIVKDDTVFVIPSPMEKNLKKKLSNASAILVAPGSQYETDDFSFETVPSYNKLKPFHPKKAGWCGYIINVGGTRVYIAGDMDDIKEAEEVKCDIALVPIGGFYTMNYKEAAGLVNKMKPKYAIPTHYGDLVGKPSDGEEFKKLVDENIRVEIKI